MCNCTVRPLIRAVSPGVSISFLEIGNLKHHVFVSKSVFQWGEQGGDFSIYLKVGCVNSFKLESEVSVVRAQCLQVFLHFCVFDEQGFLPVGVLDAFILSVVDNILPIVRESLVGFIIAES